MLELIAQKLQGIVLGALVLLISAVFILQFGGPQAEGCSMNRTPFAAKVYGTTINEGELRAAMLWDQQARNLPADSPQRVEIRRKALDALVQRSLLADKARELGFTVDDRDVMRDIAKDCKVLLSTIDYSNNWSQQRVGFPCKNEKDKFDKEVVSRFVRFQLRRSLKEFSEWQTEEILAQRMHHVLTATLSVGEDELWTAYVREKERAQLKYVRFSPTHYESALDASKENVRAWAQENQKRIDEEHERLKHRYTDLEKQVRSSHILIKAGTEASVEEKTAAHDKASGLLKKIRAGADFATLAKENSDDNANAAKGGDLGYNPKGRMVEAFDEVQFALKPGSVSDVVETEFGFHIIRVEDVREGDVPLDEAKAEIATELYQKSFGEEQAKAAAEQLLARLQAGTSIDAVEKELEPAEDEKDSSPLSPKVRETREFGRADTPIAGPFDSTPLVKAAFEELSMDKPIAAKPMKLGNEWLVYVLTSSQRATREAFTDEEKARLQAGLIAGKQRDFMNYYVQTLQDQARADGKVVINQNVINGQAQTEQDPS